MNENKIENRTVALGAVDLSAQARHLHSRGGGNRRRSFYRYLLAIIIASRITASALALETPIIESDDTQPPKEPAEFIGPCVVAIVVVVVGTYIAYRLVRFCREHGYGPPAPPPPPTRPNPPGNNTSRAEVIEYAAIVWLTNALPDLPNADYPVLDLTVSGSGLEPALIEQPLTRAEFFNSLTNHGLPDFNTVSLSPGESFYGRSGRPATNSPIHVSIAGDGSFTVNFGGGTNRVVVSASKDLHNWQTLSTSELPNGMTLNFSPLTTGEKEFYKISR